MKEALSISIGSSIRNKTVIVNLLGEEVRISRIATDGDMIAAREKFRELDGQVDAFGVGGTDLGLFYADRWYPLHSVLPIIQDVKITPVADGCGLKNTLEIRCASILEAEIGGYLDQIGRSVLVMTGVDRYGLLRSFVDAGYQYTLGDVLFSLGLPFPVKSERALKRILVSLIPLIGRLPFEWVYPTGDKQHQRKPKYTWVFQQSSVIAGDCNYITRYMPDDLEGKVIVTNTTTPADVDLFTKAGVKYLMTTTPVYEGRSFGTNMMEAALLAVSGYKQKVDLYHHQPYFKMIEGLVNTAGLQPELRALN